MPKKNVTIKKKPKEYVRRTNIKFDWDAFYKKYYEQYHAEELENAEKKKADVKRQVEAEALNRFPVVKLNFAIDDTLKAEQGEDDFNEWTLITQETHPEAGTYKMTLVDYDTLDRLRSSRKNIRFASSKPSPIMKQIQENLGEFIRSFDDLRNNQHDIGIEAFNEIRAGLENQIAVLEEECQVYLRTHRKKPWSDAGKARRQLVVESLKIIREQRTALAAFQNSLPDLERSRNANRADFQSREVERRSKIVDDEINVIAAERAKNATQREEEKFNQEGGLRSLQTVQIANLLLDKNHNPFEGYSLENTDEKSAPALDESVRAGSRDFLDLSQNFLVKHNILGTYTSDALIEISNLMLIDQIMGENRDKLQYSVKYHFYDQNNNLIVDDKGQPIDFAAWKEEDFKKYQQKNPQKKIQCKVYRVFADPIVEDFRAGKAKNDTINTVGMFITKECATNIANMDVYVVSQKLKLNINDENSSKIVERLKKYKQAIDNSNGVKNQSLPVVSIFTQQAIKRQLAMGIFEDRETYGEDNFKGTLMVDNHQEYFNKQFIRRLDLAIESDVTENLHYDENIGKEKMSMTDISLIPKSLIGVIADGKEVANKDLQTILEDIRTALKLESSSLFSNISGNKTLKCKYDELATKLYKEITAFVESEEGRKLPTVVAGLKEWKDKIFSTGSLAVPGKSDILLDRTGGKYESDLLQSAQLLNEKSNVYIKDFSEEPLFIREPLLSDIRQGKVGNCYFLATLATLIKERPDEIKQMMVESDDHKSVYCRFYDAKQKPFYIKVDKKIPVYEVKTKTGNYEHFANGEATPLWVQIYEKAYLLSPLRAIKEDEAQNDDDYKEFEKKLDAVNKKNNNNQTLTKSEKVQLFNNGYDSLNGGNGVNVVTHITGSGSLIFYNSEYQPGELLVQLREANQKQLLGVENKYVGFNAVLFEEIMKEASKNLTQDKTHIFEQKENPDDKDLHKFIIHDRICMEDVIDAITNVKKIKNFKPEKVEWMKEEIVTLIREHQLQANDETKKMEIRKEGLYSKGSMELFDILKDAVDKKRLLTCSFRHELGKYNGGGNEYEKIELPKSVLRKHMSGYVAKHEYSVVDYREKNGKKYVVVRNPWGHGERIKKDVKLEGEIFSYITTNRNDRATVDDGVFEIELNSFVGNLKNLVAETKKDFSEVDFANAVVKEYVQVLGAKYPNVLQEIQSEIGSKDNDVIIAKQKSTEVVKRLIYYASADEKVVEQFTKDSTLPKGYMENLVTNIIEEQNPIKQEENIKKQQQAVAMHP